LSASGCVLSLLGGSFGAEGSSPLTLTSRSQDTVASVGAVIPRTLPFAFGASYIRTFRHALALDEARARYYPQPWIYEDALAGEPQDRASDVKEVWFAGAHSNVGGGEFEYDGGRTPALSHLSLRWMLREAVEAGFEVDPARVAENPLFAPFVDRARRTLGSASRGDDEALEAYLRRARDKNPDVDEVMAATVFLAARPSPEMSADALSPRANHVSFKLELRPAEERKKRGVKGRLADWWSRVGTRAMTAFWWLLEVSPTVKIFWDAEGNERRWSIRCVRDALSLSLSRALARADPRADALLSLARSSNNGRGRHLPPSPSFHFSVKERLDAHGAAAFGPGNNENYPEGGRYQIKAHFSQGQGLGDVTFVE